MGICLLIRGCSAFLRQDLKPIRLVFAPCGAQSSVFKFNVSVVSETSLRAIARASVEVMSTSDDAGQWLL